MEDITLFAKNYSSWYIFLNVWKVFCILWKLDFHHLLHCLFLMLYFMVYNKGGAFFNKQNIIFSTKKAHVHTEITSDYVWIVRSFYDGIWDWMERKAKLKNTEAFLQSFWVGCFITIYYS